MRLEEPVDFVAEDRADLAIAGYAVLDEVARIVLEHPELERLEIAVTVGGLSASRSRKSLGKSRAEAIRAYLVENGVDPKRLRAVGHAAAAGKPGDPEPPAAAVSVRILRQSTTPPAIPPAMVAPGGPSGATP